MAIDSSRARFWAAVLAVVLLSLGLRLHGLGRESLFMDELTQVGTYYGTFPKILQWAATHPQPPLDYWIGALMGHPESDVLVRLPAVFFGAGSVLLLILLCSRFIPGPAAALPGLILALSPYSIYFSQQARPYQISIFFTLATLLALDRVLRRPGPSRWATLLLFACATGFLWSRVYTPMVTVGSLILVLGARIALPRRAPGPWLDAGRKKLLLSAAALAGALVAFLPLFLLVLAKGTERGFASTGGNGPLALLAKGISSFTFTPIVQAYMAQLDPLGLILLPFVLAAPLLALASRQWRGDPLLSLVPLALPVAAVVEVIGFGATANFEIWRPPFPIWMLPFCLVSGAASAAFLWRSPWFRSRVPGTFLAAFLVLAAGMSAKSMVEQKSRLMNDDLKGLGAYLEKTANPFEVQLFGSVVPPYGWEPSFDGRPWGFPRYYHGKTPTLLLADIQKYSDKMAAFPGEPVFIIYRFRNFYLTPGSPYPIYTAPKGEEEIGIGTLAEDPAFEVKLFNSYAVIRLRQKTGNLGQDAYEGLERIIRDYPQWPSHLGRLHLAAAFLGRSVGAPSWKEHRARAEEALGSNPGFAARLLKLRD